MSYPEAMIRIHEAGAQLAAARVEEAEAFSRYRLLLPTDNQARAAAVIETGSAVDVCRAEWEAARAFLQVAVDEIVREATICHL